MKTENRRRLLFASGTAILLTVLSVFAAVFFLRHLGNVIRLLPVGEEIKKILAPTFDQLINASITIKWFVPLILLLVPSLLFFFCLPKGKTKPFVLIIYLFLGILSFLLAFLFSVLFSKVNGVRLFDVLRSLLRLIASGLLDRM